MMSCLAVDMIFIFRAIRVFRGIKNMGLDHRLDHQHQKYRYSKRSAKLKVWQYQIVINPVTNFQFVTPAYLDQTMINAKI